MALSLIFIYSGIPWLMFFSWCVEDSYEEEFLLTGNLGYLREQRKMCRILFWELERFAHF